MALQATKYDMPMMVLSMAMSAASSPVFLAGTLVTHNAEVLAGVVLTQLFKPGHPTFYGSSTTSFDIKGGSAPVGSPELGVISAGVAKLAQYYDLPCVVAGS
jgi:trimethylamine--corrinoid protein Co-methyltransferase